MKQKLWIFGVLFCGSFCLSALWGGWWLYAQGVEKGRRLAVGGDLQRSSLNGLVQVGESNSPVAHRVIPGEFECQRALLITWPGPSHPFVLAQSPRDRQHVFSALNRLFVEIISATHHRVQVVCLVADEPTRGHVRELLRMANIPPASIQILRTSAADLWTRDFGPVTVKTSKGSFLFVEGQYKSNGRLPGSSKASSFLARRFHFELEQLPLHFEGGNLLSNGAGLCVTTTALLDWNHQDSPKSTQSVMALLRRHLGANQVVFLKPLVDDKTGHVDLFVTFTAPDTAVVAQASHQADPANAKILDENARRLSRVVTACGPLQVHRIPMPPPGENGRRFSAASYTNVVYANGVLLVPRYSGVDQKLQQRVVQKYQELLPGWSIVSIDADVLKIHSGSLHCVVNNLFRIRNDSSEQL